MGIKDLPEFGSFFYGGASFGRVQVHFTDLTGFLRRLVSEEAVLYRLWN